MLLGHWLCSQRLTSPQWGEARSALRPRSGARQVGGGNHVDSILSRALPSAEPPPPGPLPLRGQRAPSLTGALPPTGGRFPSPGGSQKIRGEDERRTFPSKHLSSTR